MAEADLCDVCGFPSSSIEGDCGHAACNVCWMGCFALEACCVDPACSHSNDRVRMLVSHGNGRDVLHASMQEMFGSDYDSDEIAQEAEALGNLCMHDKMILHITLCILT